jgi:hypothetical protein
MPDLWSNRITIVTGGYGSGKTEVSINLALRKRQFYPLEERVSLVDLDIVNPYFRSRDRASHLLEKGIYVIAPEGSMRTADLPALPAAIGGHIQDARQHMILDVGGDPAGATALGRYSSDITKAGYDMFLIINPKRYVRFITAYISVLAMLIIVLPRGLTRQAHRDSVPHKHRVAITDQTIEL